MEDMTLKQLRKNKGFTQKQMAELLGYKGKSGYCQLENGVVRITVEQAVRIAEVLEVTPGKIFSLLTGQRVHETSVNDELAAAAQSADEG